MVSHAVGRCRICGKRHKLSIYGSQENQHVLLEKINLQLIILNTVCTDCIVKFERFVKDSEKIAITQNISSQEENTERCPTRKNAVTDNHTENWPKVQFYVENNEWIRDTDFKREKESVGSECGENCAGKTMKNVGEESKNTEEVKPSTIDKDHAPEKSKITRAKRIPRCKMYCDFCSKEFTHRGDLKRHKRKHTGERPYECTLCLKKFSQLSNLSRHRLVHSGEKPFSCEKCGQSYSRKGRLANHIIRHLCREKKIPLHV